MALYHEWLASTWNKDLDQLRVNYLKRVSGDLELSYEVASEGVLHISNYIFEITIHFVTNHNRQEPF